MFYAAEQSSLKILSTFFSISIPASCHNSLIGCFQNFFSFSKEFLIYIFLSDNSIRMRLYLFSSSVSYSMKQNFFLPIVCEGFLNDTPSIREDVNKYLLISVLYSE